MDNTIENKQNTNPIKPCLHNTLLITICLVAISLIFITYNSIQGYRDLVGIKYVENDFKPMKQMYLLNCCFVVGLVILLVIFMKKYRKNSILSARFWEMSRQGGFFYCII